MPLKIKFNSPKAYKFGLTFTRLNCETGSWIGLQGSAPGFYLPGQRGAEPGEGRQSVCLSVSQSVCLCDTSAHALPDPLCRSHVGWHKSQLRGMQSMARYPVQLMSLTPTHTTGTPWCRKLLSTFFFCQVSMPGQILVGTIATNPSVNLIS